MEYRLFREGGVYYLLTDKKEKSDATFEWWRNSYRKEIDPYGEDVDKCFDVYGYVIYDSGIPEHSKEWRLMGMRIWKIT